MQRLPREVSALIKTAGYTIQRKLGKEKFISVFKSTTSSHKKRRKRTKLITKLVAECLADKQIAKRLRRSEDLTELSLRVHKILRHPEYNDINDKDILRYTIAQLLIDPEHRSTVEEVLKENRKRQWPEYRPFCTTKKIKSPEIVVKTIFDNMDRAWNYGKGRYYKTKAGVKFQKAMKDMMSKDWVTNYCLLAGYVPIMKERKLGQVGKIIAESCGCRKFDKFAFRKSFLKKVHREASNYKYHTMKRTLKRMSQKTVVNLHSRPDEDHKRMCTKHPRPGIWTRVFKGTRSHVSNLGDTSNYRVASAAEYSEKTFMEHNLQDISSPFLTTAEAIDVAIKVFSLTPELPLKLMPARVLTYLELSAILDHPNIIRFLESFATTSSIFVVMPYAQNRSLHHIINHNGRVMEKTAQVWAFHIAMAVQYLHAGGIIHRNIKCSNILINHNFDAILTGFGSAKIKWLDLLHFQQTESTNYHAGYRPYRAPEVLRRKPYCLPPIDVWSLGIVLFRMLNNCFPYCYHNKGLMCRQQHLSKWRKTWRRESLVSQHCLRLLKKMLEPHPAKRITIDGVLNHDWFGDLQIPKSHVKAVRKATFLLLHKEEKCEETFTATSSTKQLSHKDVTATLDDVYELLEKAVEKPGVRKFPRLETRGNYTECYSKYKLRQGALVRAIDAALRKRKRKLRSLPKPLEYEPYMTEQEKVATQEQLDAGIHELKKHPTEARKFLESPSTNRGVKLSLDDVVKAIQEKEGQSKFKENETASKSSLFAPKREGSEPRSILSSKYTRSGQIQPIMKVSSIMTGLTTKDSFPPTVRRVETDSVNTDTDLPLPKLEFLKSQSSDSKVSVTKPVVQKIVQKEVEEESSSFRNTLDLQEEEEKEEEKDDDDGFYAGQEEGYDSESGFEDPKNEE